MLSRLILSSQCKPIEQMGLRTLRGQLSMLPKASPDVHVTACDYLEDDTGLNPLHTQVFCEGRFNSCVCEHCVCYYLVPKEDARLMNQRAWGLYAGNSHCYLGHTEQISSSGCSCSCSQDVPVIQMSLLRVSFLQNATGEQVIIVLNGFVCLCLSLHLSQ